MSDNMHGYMPIEWDFGDEPSDGIGGDVPSDAGAIYIVNDDAYSDDFERVVLKTSLSEIIDYAINGHVNIYTGKIGDADGIEIMQRIKTALQVEIDKIESAILPGGQ
jgi:hypothetical protein